MLMSLPSLPNIPSPTVGMSIEPQLNSFIGGNFEYIPNMNITDDLCEKDAVLVRFPLNRILKATGLILSASSIPLLIYVMRRFIMNGAFHKNIQIILYCYFVNALLEATVLPFCLGYMISTSFAIKPCDIYLNRTIYIIGHISNFYLVLTQINLQTVACIERFVATIYCETYYTEHSALLGSVLVLGAIFSPAAILYAVYFDQDFQEPQPSVVIPPDAARIRINYYCIYCIFLCIVSLTFIRYLIYYNRKLTANCVGQFCRRLQTSENITTTSFITSIVGLQLSIFLISAISILAFRLTEHLYDPYNLAIQTLKTSLFLVPLFLILLPVITQYEFNRLKKLRKQASMEHVFIKHTGEEGIQNYQKVISSLWN